MRRFSIIGLLLLPVMLWAQPRLSLTTERHLLGQIEWKKPVMMEYSIQNTGSSPLVLSNVTASCGCTNLQWTQTPIAPGERGVITALFDAKQLGHFDKEIEIYSNAEPHLVYLSFAGEVVTEVKDFTKTHPYQIGDIRLSANSIDFADANRGDTPSITIQVANLSDRPYEPILMHLPPYIKMERTPNVLLKGKKGEIKLTLNSDKLNDLGLTQSMVYLARFSGDKVSEENELPVSAVLLPDFSELTEQQRINAPIAQLNDTVVDLKQPLLKKKKAYRDLTLSNVGKSPLQIRSVQVFHPALGVELMNSKLAPGESSRLRVSVIKKKINRTRRPLRVLMITNDPNHPKLEIEVKY